jgi:hypothetical protein
MVELFTMMNSLFLKFAIGDEIEERLIADGSHDTIANKDDDNG